MKKINLDIGFREQGSTEDVTALLDALLYRVGSKGTYKLRDLQDAYRVSLEADLQRAFEDELDQAPLVCWYHLEF